MATTQASATHDHHQSPIATQQAPQGQMHGRRQPEHVSESSPPLHRYLGNSYLQSVATTESAPPQESALPPIVREVLRSSGQPLDPTTHTFMESRFDADFSQVRVHSDGQAVASARALESSAYTIGRDIVFGAGQFAPHTAQGRRLLAHELTHVVQQGQSVSSPHRLLSSPVDTAEVEADRISTSILTSSPPNPITVQVSAQQTAIVQRQVSPEDWMFLPRPGEFRSANSLKEFSPKTPSPTFSFGQSTWRRGKLVTEETLMKWAMEETEKGMLFDDLVHRVKGSSDFDGGSPEEKQHWVSVLRKREPELREIRQQLVERQRADRLYAIEREKQLSIEREKQLSIEREKQLSKQPIKLFTAWADPWRKRHGEFAIQEEALRKKIHKADPARYANNMDLFRLGRSDALGPEYEEIASKLAFTSGLLECENDVLTWIEAMAARTLAGRRKPLTLEEIDQYAKRCVEDLPWARWAIGAGLAVVGGGRAGTGNVASPNPAGLRFSPHQLARRPPQATPTPPGASVPPPTTPTVPGPKQIPAKVSGGTLTPGAPPAPVGPAGAAKNSPIPPAARHDFTPGGSSPPQPAKPPAPASAPPATPPAATRSVVVPAPVKPPPPATPVRQSPASPLSRWDRLKMRLGIKYLEAVMESKLSNVVPTKIAGGSLPGQTPAVIVKATPSPTAPTPTPLPRTSARPPTVSPAKTGTPSALSRPPTTEGAVKTLAPAPKQVGKTPQAPPVSVVLPRAYTPRAANQNALPGKTPQQHVVPLAATGTDGLVGPVKIIKSGKQGNASGLRIVASGERETPGQGTPVPGTVQVSGTTAPSPPHRPSPAPSPERNFDDESTAVARLPPSASQGEQPVSHHVIRRSKFTSLESLNAFLGTVWARRQEILAQGNAGAVYDMYRYKPGSASQTQLSNEQRARFLRSQETLVHELGFPRSTAENADRLLQQAEERGEQRVRYVYQQGDPETGFLQFRNERRVLERNRHEIVERIYLSVRADVAPEVMRFVTREFVSNAQTTGISGAKLAGPREVGQRRDAIVIYSEDFAHTQRALERLLEYQRTHPHHFEDFPMPMTQPVSRGISIGSDPVSGSEQESFGSVRAEAIYEALREATSWADFFHRVEQNFRTRRVDPAQPHRNLPPPTPPRRARP